MAKSVLDIVIKTVKEGGGDKQTVKGLVDLKAGVTQATAVFAALAGAAYLVDKALEATAGKAVAYANKVENLSNATGMSTEASSRTIQVLDDLRVSYETLEASVKKNSDTTDFSIDGLSKLSSEYQALTTQTEKQAFAQQHFGKQWVDFIKVLETSPEKLMQMNGAVQANLILTEDNIRASKEYQENLDNLNDKFEGISINVGNNVIPTLNNMLDSVDRMSTMTRQQSMALVYLDDALSKGKITTEEYSAAVEKLKIPLDANEAALQNNSDAVQELTINYGDQLNMIEKVSKASAKQIKEITYNNLVAKLSVDGLTAAEAKLAQEAGKSLGIFNQASINNAASIDELTRKLQEGTISVYEFSAAIAAIERNINVVVSLTAHDATNTSGIGLTSGGRAIGGNVDRGVPYQVHQDEIYIPQQDGYVLTRRDAQAILSGKAGGGGGGSRHVNIYGGVQIVANRNVNDILAELTS